MASFI